MVLGNFILYLLEVNCRLAGLENQSLVGLGLRGSRI